MSGGGRRSRAALWAILAVPTVAIILALIVGAIVILVFSLLVSRDTFDLALPLKAYGALIGGSLGSFDGLVETCVQAAPLLLAGLGVALGFRPACSTSARRASSCSAPSPRSGSGRAMADAAPIVSDPARAPRRR